MSSESDELKEIIDDFIVESEEIMETLDQKILSMEKDSSSDNLNVIFRGFHTIKGTSGFLGFQKVSTLTHSAENVLNLLRKGEKQVSSDMIDVLLEALDILKLLISNIKEKGDEGSPDNLEHALEELKRFQPGEEKKEEKKEEQPPEPVEAASPPPIPEIPEVKEESPALDDNDDLKEIIDDFIVESEEIMETLDQKILSMEKDSSSDNLNVIFRGFHTIKGTSGFLGFQKVSTLTHSAENVLNLLRKGEKQVSSDMIDVLLEALDILKLLISNIKEEGNEGSPDNLEHALEELKRFQPGEEKKEEKKEEQPPEPVEAASPPPIPEIPEVKEESRVPDDEGKKLGELLIQEGFVTEEDIDDALKEQAEGSKLGEIFIQKNIISRDQLDSVLKKQKPKQERIEQTIRVEVSRLDNLMNLVGELVLGRNRLLQVCRKIEIACEEDKSVDDLNESIAQLGVISGFLQESIMKTRMLPIQRVIGKFPRIIRSLQKSTKKDFDLKIFGEDTELDKSIIEEIGDPLVHLIRNAVDHGIEYPEKRIAAGKPSKGTINLRAFHEGHSIIIEIQDDGKGIDIEKIKEKAIKKNMVTRQKADIMAKSDILKFIFQPGFSTADIVTEISGRGVGMDVVKQNITKLKGIVEIDTDLGVGTIFRIKLPLTLAIIQALIVGLEGDIFAIPLSSVVETVRIKPDEIYQVENRNIINLRGSIIPLIDLKRNYEIQGEEGYTIDNSGRVYIVIIGVAEKRKGLIVDSLLGQEEIVIKSLGKYLRGIPGFSGCTIMGDGKITLILDVETLFDEDKAASLQQ